MFDNTYGSVIKSVGDGVREFVGDELIVDEKEFPFFTFPLPLVA